MRTAWFSAAFSPALSPLARAPAGALPLVSRALPPGDRAVVAKLGGGASPALD